MTIKSSDSTVNYRKHTEGFNMFYIENQTNGLLAHKDSKGQHDNKTTNSCLNAISFYTYGEASDYSQNFNDLWTVTEY